MSLISFSPHVDFNLYLRQANGILGAANAGKITGVTTVSAAAQKLEKMLKASLETSFNKDYPTNQLPPGQTDFGYMAPYSALKPGSVPKCVHNQIATVFKNWQLTYTNKVVDQIASTITQSVYNHGGQPGFEKGVTQVSATESIDWEVVVGQINVQPNTLGICYCFAANAAINIG